MSAECPDCGTVSRSGTEVCPACGVEMPGYESDDLLADLEESRAWAHGRSGYDDLAAQADEKMSPPWIDDGNGYG